MRMISAFCASGFPPPINLVAEKLDSADLEAVVVLRSAAESEPRTTLATINTPSVVEIEAGQVWEFETTLDGYWARTETLFVPEEGASVTISLFPTGAVEGSVVMVPNGVAPQNLGVRFRPTTANATVGEAVTCPISDRRFTCSLPVGIWDLRVRAETYVSSFFWSVEVLAGKSIDLGQVQLRQKMERLELQTGHQYVVLEIPMVDVEGEVRIKDEVVPAKVIFESTATEGFEEDTTSIVLNSDFDGVIRGVLPYEGTYNVVIEGTEPPLKRRVRGVEVEQISSSTVARFVIELPETNVSGVVVDGSGRPTSGAMVMCQKADDPRDTSVIATDDDGHFQLFALEDGRYLVHARSEDRRSRETDLKIDDTEAPKLKLILDDSSELTGRIINLEGSGVAGASIMVGGPGFTSGGQAVSGVDGSFSLPVPEKIQTLVFIVQAPGYGLHTKSANVEIGNEIVLRLTQVGAGLTLTGLARPHERGKTVFLLHEGGFLAEAILRMWAAVYGFRSMDPDRLEIPMLEPGSYQVCAAGMDVIAVLQGFFSAQGGPSGFECEDVYLQPGVETTVAVSH